MPRTSAMTVRRLEYVIAVAECGSITEAAHVLRVSQPSLSTAVRDVECAAGITIFTRSSTGVTLTRAGLEFLGYARQVVQQMELLEARYVSDEPERLRFAVSTQHYTFAANAFVELVRRFGRERYDFMLNETRTHQIVEDVRARISDLGVLHLSRANAPVLRKLFDDAALRFHPLFDARPHVFLRRGHPLAARGQVTLGDLRPYPRLCFVQGAYESAAFAEEPFSDVVADRIIRISDRAAIVNLMIGLDGYTVSSGIFPRYLHGEQIVAVPLDEPEVMTIGYVLNEDRGLSAMGRAYVDALRAYRPEASIAGAYAER